MNKKAILAVMAIWIFFLMLLSSIVFVCYLTVNVSAWYALLFAVPFVIIATIDCYQYFESVYRD